jgi:hypothetical protein
LRHPDDVVIAGPHEGEHTAFRCEQRPQNSITFGHDTKDIPVSRQDGSAFRVQKLVALRQHLNVLTHFPSLVVPLLRFLGIGLDAADETLS